MLTEDHDVKCMAWNSYEDDLGCIPDFKVHSSTSSEIIAQEVLFMNLTWFGAHEDERFIWQNHGLHTVD
ncbi:hypothetical protein OPV22_030591 [Ensete ventricosum]|uniref:Uncharacterized protein n=1 Tax=Ensete ventricosum TaxID=4639 RepID=A0AAV8QGJ5_ENSVE|nr:hypothetical protein OPV22_030591 [Ensete ventricosum]